MPPQRDDFFQNAQMHSTESTPFALSAPPNSETALLTSNLRQPPAAWNATRQSYTHKQCAHQLVATQAAATPASLALAASDESMSYQELNRRANQLAHHLQAVGVSPNVLVGLCIERSPAMVVGLLGILKAGGAYLPLDPSYPPERLNFMLADAQAPVLVTTHRLSQQITTQGTEVVCLDSDAPLLAKQSGGEPSTAVSIEDLAYVIYTSGSTGQPKGVQITHNGLLNLILWHQRAFAVTDQDKATQLASPAFDATGWELWPYLTCGASVSFPDEKTRVTPSLLRDWLIRQGITITFQPTPLAERMIALEWPPAISLRLMLTGGDMLHHYPPPTLPFTLVNNYGPTEATVVATSGAVPPASEPDQPPSIGRPIANTQTYILDEQLRQVSVGEPGELYIGGIGLARGYLNRPELTAEKFIRHPLSNEPDTRLYKTGDLARYLPDGQIAFLGRADHQIKLRGYRIEPEEIAAALNKHSAIQTSIVIAREDIAEEKRLVAYVVLEAEARPTATELREMLLQSLPDYMIPATFVHLEALPQTPNSKVDRARLPMPDEGNTLQDETFTAPRTLIEGQLAETIASLLRVEKVSVGDNFFMLGGHSLLGTQLIVNIASIFGVDLALRTLFEAPTIRQLAAEVEWRIVAKLATMDNEEARRDVE